MTCAEFMTSCLYVIVDVFKGFDLLTSILALAIICSCIVLVKAFFRGLK